MYYTIILPISLGSTNDWELFSKFGLKTYEKYLDDTLKEFIIIASEKDIEVMKQFIKTTLPITYHDEKTFLSPHLQTRGWFKQQLLKLLISNIVSTKYYLVLDADMYLNQPLSYKDLFYRDLIKYNSEPWQTFNNCHFSQNSKWWRASCNIMNFPIEQLHNNKYLMSVTPQVLIKNVVTELLSFLYRDNWQEYLCEMEFTEFTLYWIYCIVHNHSSLYTTNGFPLWKHDHECNILDVHYASRKCIANAFIKPHSFFSVIQGYLPISVSPYIEEGLKFLNRIDIDCIFLCASMLIPNRYQSFTPQERYLQTIETAISSKQYVPNSLIVLIEGSVLTKDHKKGLNDVFDVLLEYGKDPDVLSFVNHPDNIGHGECKLLEKGIDYLFDTLLHKYRPSNIIKLGARYVLTSNFNLKSYSTTHFTFRSHYDETAYSYVYTTGLFSIPVRELEFFKEILLKSFHVLTFTKMVEKMYYNMIPPHKIHEIKTLGLKGKLSYNQTYFEK